MNCTEFSSLLDAFMEGALPDEAAAAMKAHAAECPSCGMLLQARRDCRAADEQVEVPASFSAAWRESIREEKQMEEKKSGAWKKYLAAAAALVFVLGGTMLTREGLPAARRETVKAAPTANYDYSAAKASGSLSAAYRADSAAFAAPMEAAEAEMDYEDYAAEAMDEGAAQNTARPEKIIRTANFTIRTAAYDEDMAALKNLTEQLGGRIEYLNSSGDAAAGQIRNASLTLRIPAERLDEFLAGARGIGNVTAMTEGMEDVSETYYDTQTRLETQKAKLARLQELMRSASRVSDLIEIESAISDAQYYIDRYTAQLKGYDGKIAYSTVRVTMREVRVVEAENVSWGQRIWNGLENSLTDGWEFVQDMVIFLVSCLPWLAALGAAVLIVRAIVRKRRKKKE